jgi:three-Cys-motif partner protein
MAAPQTTVWELEPHTRAKHAILKRYLQAWTPILSLGGFPQIAYIDGFAGPGRYSKGEDGSPVIALKIAIEQTKPGTRVLFLFVELDSERARVLQTIVDGIQRTADIRVKVAAGKTFEQAFEEFLAFYTKKRQSLPPTFAFIDPFGWKGVPFSIVKQVMSYQSCEVLVTFMYEEINRFLSQGQQGENFDSFFGTPRWRDCNSIIEPHTRNRFLHDLYVEQLRSTAGAKYVRSFEMRNGRDVTDYFLFYATNSRKGLQKMKEAMWKVDAVGEFTFSDATDPNQMVLFGEPAVDVLKEQILRRFSGRDATVADVEEFVLAETAFRETHYKKILKDLEIGSPTLLTAVNPPAGRRAGTYGRPDLVLRFSSC